MARFGKYELLERIGIGGMAEVFKAKIFGAEGFERLIAIKRILPNLVQDEDFVKMFVDEAKIAVRLNHPNIVGIDDLGKADGTLFIAMEFVQGKDLRAVYDVERARKRTTPVGISCHIIMKMCEALHHAHFATGPSGEPLHVIHRDVSPQNVLLSFDGEVKVADFGLAKAKGRMVQTQAGVVKGKLAYMSPEQLRGDEIDHRVDVFGLGIVLYELLTGHRLFLGPSDMETLRRVYEAKVPDMTPINPDVDAELEAIVRKALAKDRDKRFPTALELFEALQHYVYAKGVYAGTSALRRYVHDAFPDAAPPTMGLPPFAPSPAEPRPTTRPPRRPTIPPPASEPALKAARMPRELSGDPLSSAAAPFGRGDNAYAEDVDLIASTPHPDVPTLQIDTRTPESSEMRETSGEHDFPSRPPGVYDTHRSAEDSFDTSLDTNPAPAPLEEQHPAIADTPWDDTTEFEPLKVPLPAAESELDTADEIWGEDPTQVGDPRKVEGSSH